MEVIRVEQRTYIKIAVRQGRNAMEGHSELVEALGKRLFWCKRAAQLGLIPSRTTLAT